MSENTTMKPVKILSTIFKQNDETVSEFFAQIKEVKKDSNYSDFVEECAKHLGVQVDWSGN